MNKVGHAHTRRYIRVIYRGLERTSISILGFLLVSNNIIYPQLRPYSNCDGALDSPKKLYEPQIIVRILLTWNAKAQSLRVQVQNNHILSHNVHLDYYYA